MSQPQAAARRSIKLKGDPKDLLAKATERRASGEAPRNEGEEKAVLREQERQLNIRKAGADAAALGQKQSSNPHVGGSNDWWSWHGGYTDHKKQAADLARAEVFAAAEAARKAKKAAGARKSAPVTVKAKKKK